MDGIYLDYAATAAIRPPGVADAIAAYLRDIGATPGRSAHRRALDAGRLALRCRMRLAELMGIEGDPGRIAFQLNATHALNVALFGLLRPGDRVVRTNLDHNSVRRPLAALSARGVVVDVLDFSPTGEVDLDHAMTLLEGDDNPARLFVLPHASNVTGAVLPVGPLAERARDVGAATLVDLAQTAGHYPVDLAELSVDMAAFTGHKGLLGPQGIGGLWVREGLDVKPTFFGGTGGDSYPPTMPDTYPDHLEAGTQNAPGMAGLAASVGWILERGLAKLRSGERELKQRLVHGLSAIPEVTILSSTAPASVGIVTFVHDQLGPGDLARRMEQSHGIQGRSGLHCAPDAHRVIGTLETGAYRLSVGWASTADDIDRAIEAVRAVSGSES